MVSDADPALTTDESLPSGDAVDISVLLRAAREQAGEELADISGVLRIRLNYLEAIEKGEFDTLPGTTYTLGFIRSYAEHLGMDGAALVEQFKSGERGIKIKPELSFPSLVPQHGIPGAAIILVGILIAGVGYGGWYFISTSDKFATLRVQPPPASTQALTDSAPEPAAAPSVPRAAPTPAVQDAQTNPPTATAPSAAEVPAPPGQNGNPTDAATTTANPPPVAAAAQSPVAPPELTAPTPAAEKTPPLETPVSNPVPASVAEQIAARPQDATPEPAMPAAVETAREDAAVTEPQTSPEANSAPSPEPNPPDAATLPDPARNAVGGVPAPTTTETETARNPDAVGATAVPVAAPAAPPPAPEPDPVQVTLDDTGPGRIPAPPLPTAVPEAADPLPATITPTDVAVANGTDAARIVVRAKLDSWIQIRDDRVNQLIMTRLLRQGDSYDVPDRPGLTLLTGNAGALDIVVDGEAIPAIGPLGAVRRHVALDAEKLRNGTAVLE